MKLTINERIKRQGNSEKLRRWNNFILQIGDGIYPFEKSLGEGFIKLPDNIVSKARYNK